MGIPCAFVRHHWRINRARNFGETLDTLDWLLEIDELEALHAPIGADRLPGRAVSLVGVDAQRDAGPDGLADTPYHVHITIGIDADLNLDGADSFLCDLRHFALTETIFRASDTVRVLSALLSAGAVTREPERGRLSGDVMISLK